MRKKVTVIGAGNVGATCAMFLADMNRAAAAAQVAETAHA